MYDQELKSLKSTDPPLGGMVWNPYMRSYVPLIGKPVDTSGVRITVAEIRRGSSERMAKLAQGVLDGEITNLAEFAIEFKQEIKRLYLSTHVLARGGVAQMTQSDWGKLGAAVKEQLEYADNFVRDIENVRIGVTDLAGDVIVRESGIPELGDGFLARAEMYTESAWGGAGEFENVVRDRELKLGSLERRVLGKSVKSCDDCIELAERDWQPPSLLPDIGDTECGPGCNCSFEFENKELDDLADAFGHIQIGIEGNEPTEQPEFTLYPDEKSLLS